MIRLPNPPQRAMQHPPLPPIPLGTPPPLPPIPLGTPPPLPPSPNRASSPVIIAHPTDSGVLVAGAAEITIAGEQPLPPTIPSNSLAHENDSSPSSRHVHHALLRSDSPSQPLLQSKLDSVALTPEQKQWLLKRQLDITQPTGSRSMDASALGIENVTVDVGNSRTASSRGVEVTSTTRNFSSVTSTNTITNAQILTLATSATSSHSERSVTPPPQQQPAHAVSLSRGGIEDSSETRFRKKLDFESFSSTGASLSLRSSYFGSTESGKESENTVPRLPSIYQHDTAQLSQKQYDAGSVRGGLNSENESSHTSPSRETRRVDIGPRLSQMSGEGGDGLAREYEHTRSGRMGAAARGSSPSGLRSVSGIVGHVPGAVNSTISTSSFETDGSRTLETMSIVGPRSACFSMIWTWQCSSFLFSILI